MVKEERHNTRDLSYSNWHRTLPDFCYMIDLDSIEWRSNRGIVAFVEVALRDEKQTIDQQLETKTFEITILTELSQKLAVPSYIVFYNESLTTFNIYLVKDQQCKHLATSGRNEYSWFIQNL